jgi:hypothetical protein
MKRILCLIASCLFLIPLATAKPKQPLDTQLILTNSVTKDSYIEYSLTYQCRPWVTSDNITFKLVLPKGFDLEEGFSYWEGELKANVLFTREFKVKALSTAKGILKINAIMKLDNAQSVKVSSIDLNSTSVKKKSSPLPFNFGSGARNSKGERKRIRRE